MASSPKVPIIYDIEDFSRIKKENTIIVVRHVTGLRYVKTRKSTNEQLIQIKKICEVLKGAIVICGMKMRTKILEKGFLKATW